MSRRTEVDDSIAGYEVREARRYVYGIGETFERVRLSTPQCDRASKVRWALQKRRRSFAYHLKWSNHARGAAASASLEASFTREDANAHTTTTTTWTSTHAVVFAAEVLSETKEQKEDVHEKEAEAGIKPAWQMPLPFRCRLRAVLGVSDNRADVSLFCPTIVPAFDHSMTRPLVLLGAVGIFPLLGRRFW